MWCDVVQDTKSQHNWSQMRRGHVSTHAKYQDVLVACPRQRAAHLLASHDQDTTGVKVRVLHTWYIQIWRYYRCQSEGATQLVLTDMEILQVSK